MLSPWTQVAGHIQDEDALISQIAVSPLIVVLLPAPLMGVLVLSGRWSGEALGPQRHGGEGAGVVSATGESIRRKAVAASSHRPTV